MVKVCQTSDTHIGLTKPQSILKMLRKIKLVDEQDPFDLLVHNGDYCGGTEGARSVRSTVKMIRELFPDKPFISTIGNHDLWCLKRSSRKKFPSLTDFQENYDGIIKTFQDNQVHFLDEDGPYRFLDWTFIGHCGWYLNPAPNTNDQYYLPFGIEGNTHHHLYKKAQRQLEDNINKLSTSDTNIIFCSHFPVIKCEKDALFDKYSWSSSIGDFFQEEYHCNIFLNGHAHQYVEGPLRFESGSDYGKPAFKIWSFGE